MAASLKGNPFAYTGGSGWSKIMGQGIRSLASTDELVSHGSVQNRGSAADVYIAFVHGDSAPSTDTDAGVFKIASLRADGIQPINRVPLEAGMTVWIKSASDLGGHIGCTFASTS